MFNNHLPTQLCKATYKLYSVKQITNLDINDERRLEKLQWVQDHNGLQNELAAAIFLFLTFWFTYCIDKLI